MWPLALQESGEAPVSVSTEAEPTTGENGYGAGEEIKQTRHTSAADMEVAISEAASTAGTIMHTSRTQLLSMSQKRR